MANLVIVSVLDPRNYPDDSRTIRIFNEDTDIVELDEYVAAKRKEGCTVIESMLYGQSVEPLRQYLNDHPVI